MRCRSNYDKKITVPGFSFLNRDEDPKNKGMRHVNIKYWQPSQGHNDGTSSVKLEVLIINFGTNNQTCFKDLFSFNCLTSNFCFLKYFIFYRRKRMAVMDECSYLRLLNSTGKMMTYLRHNQIKFWGTAPCAQIY